LGGWGKRWVNGVNMVCVDSKPLKNKRVVCKNFDGVETKLYMLENEIHLHLATKRYR